MNEVEVALAVSARIWPDRIHRFLSDHGGARVRAQVLTAEDALAEEYQVLIIDDVSSFLTPRLVQEVQRRRRLVLGVFDPLEAADGKERLRECGVDQVIESDATADEFVVALRALVALAPSEPAIADEPDEQPSKSTLIAIGAPLGGCGATEVAVAWATRLARFAPTVLIDVDETSPAIAQRLGLSLIPNLRSAIDVIQHRHGSLESCLQDLGRLEVLPGLTGDRDWLEVRPLEVLDVVGELRSRFRYVVANIGSQLEQVGFGDSGRFAISRAVLEQADRIVGVGLSNPVSISRLILWIGRVADLNQPGPISLLVNRAPRSRYKRAEVAQELGRVLGPDVMFLAHDREVEEAAWSGRVVSSGSFYRTINKLVDRSLVS